MAPSRSNTAAEEINVTTISGGAAHLKKHKRSWGWAFFLFILGTLFPPLAVAARFGVGRDFWINLPLTLAGYIPGHVHNFYIQNIRNNKTHARTPKWAIRYGLVDTTKLERNARRSQWAHRYNDRAPDNDYENRPVEDGQVPDAPRPPPKGSGGNADGGRAPLWSHEDEGYYNPDSSTTRRGNTSTTSVDSGSHRSSGRWHYPANFDEATEIEPSRKKSKKKDKKDRWARTEEARLGVPDDVGTKRKKKSSRRSAVDDSSSYNNDAPEDAVGGLYGPSRSTGVDLTRENAGDDSLVHEF